MFFPLDPMISPLKSDNLPLEYGVLPLKCTHFAIQIPYFYLETRDFCFEPHHVSPEIAQSSLAILPFHLGKQNLKYENLKIQKMKNGKLQKQKSQKLKPLKNYDVKTRKPISHAVAPFPPPLALLHISLLLVLLRVTTVLLPATSAPRGPEVFLKWVDSETPPYQ